MCKVDEEGDQEDQNESKAEGVPTHGFVNAPLCEQAKVLPLRLPARINIFLPSSFFDSEDPFWRKPMVNRT